MGCRAFIGETDRVVGYICGGGKLIARRERKSAWCFKCRRRAVHRLYILVAEWYDPEPVWKCAGCGGDHTDFPG